MNIANTPGPPMIAMVPERTPARSQAASSDAPDGFHRTDLGLDGSAAIESTLRVNTTRLRFGEVGAVESGVEKLLVALELQLVRHDITGIRQHAFRRDDDIAFDAQRRH